MTAAVDCRLENGVAKLTLNLPEKRNVLTTGLLNILGDHLVALQQANDVRVVVLTNSGETFCAGADLSSSREADRGQRRYDLPDVLQLITHHSKPVVGSIVGNCYGGGIGLAAACDISIVRDDATFSFSEVRLGVAPAVVSVVCLPKLRRADALRLFLTGAQISGQEAAELGLVSLAVPPADVAGCLKDVLDSLRRGGPVAQAAIKTMVAELTVMEEEPAFAYARRLSKSLFDSAEGREGREAWRSRQPPSWARECE